MAWMVRDDKSVRLWGCIVVTLREHRDGCDDKAVVSVGRIDICQGVSRCNCTGTTDHATVRMTAATGTTTDFTDKMGLATATTGSTVQAPPP